MKRVAVLSLVLGVAVAVLPCMAKGKSEQGQDSAIKIGYVSPGPDTWYLRALEGAKWAAKKAGVELIAVNSDRDYEKERANTEYLINEGVACIITESWNEAGSVATAEACAQAKIGCVVFDAVHVLFNYNVDFTASVDFNWASMGKIYADWMKATYPGQNYVFVNGTLDSVVCQTVTSNLKKATDALGSNKELDNRPGQYDPEKAAQVAEDMVNSGLSITCDYFTPGGL